MHVVRVSILTEHGDSNQTHDTSQSKNMSLLTPNPCYLSSRRHETPHTKLMTPLTQKARHSSYQTRYLSPRRHATPHTKPMIPLTQKACHSSHPNHDTSHPEGTPLLIPNL